MKATNTAAGLLLAAVSLGSALPCAGARAKNAPSLKQLTVENVRMAKEHGKMAVSFDIDLSRLKLGSDNQLIYTPVLSGGTDSTVMAKIVVNGRNVTIKEEREPWRKVHGAQTTLRRVNGTRQTVAVNHTFDYEPWMDLCSLALLEDLCGCGRLQDQDRMPLGEFDNRPPAAPAMTFVTPKAEAVKARDEKGSAFVDYVVNKTNILPDYRRNRQEIAKIVATIDLVRNDPNVSITEINIHGYASPEGKYENNRRLAEGRAASLKDYVKGLYTLPDNLFTSAATPEDWAGLRRMVEGSSLPERDGILEIIDDSSLDPDAKDHTIRQRFPQAYAFILKEWYPALRHSDYTVSYVVRPFTVDETKAIMEKTPKQVSLNEMFLVAQTMEPGSPEFNKVMETAVATYPDDPTANLNAGYAELNAGDLENASRHLAKAGAGPDADHARGILAMKEHRYDDAMRLLTSASGAGVANAAENLKILERLIQLDAQNK